MGVIIQNNELDKILDDLQNERTQLMLELDKVISLFENAEQEKQDIENKIQLLKSDDPNQKNKIISNDQSQYIYIETYEDTNI